MLSITSRILREAGYDVFETTTGNGCLKIAEKIHPSLVLIDVVLPDISGDEVCRILKSTPSLSDIFIIFVTGDKTTACDKSRGLDDGADGYIVRPILNNELLSTVKAMDRIKQVENQLRKKTEENKALLSEIHHRVKNNMQIIISLLSLQAGKIEDGRCADMFKEAENRIRSMALIHENLYLAGDFANVDFHRYVRSLVNSLLRSCAADLSLVKLKIGIEDVSLGMDTAIHCGLLINEVVSNSLKHAFQDHREGEIEVALRPVNGQEFELIISDDGIGMPLELDFDTADSMGLMLVKILAVDQLEGAVDLDRDGGTTFRIRFKK